MSKVIEFPGQHSEDGEKNEAEGRSFDEIFKRHGDRYKYTFWLGDINNPESIEAMDSYVQEKYTEAALNAKKIFFMKAFGKPIISIDCEEL